MSDDDHNGIWYANHSKVTSWSKIIHFILCCFFENLCAVSVSVHNMISGFSGKICPLIS